MKDKFCPLKEGFKYFELLLLMIGSVAGVGFISGAELYHSFARFGAFGYTGIILFFCLFSALSYKILSDKIIYKNNLKMQNCNEIVSKNTIYGNFNFKSILTFFNVLMISSAMFSGLRELLKTLFYDNYYFLYALSLIIVFLILFYGVKGLSKFNLFVILFLFAIKIFMLNEINFKTININFNNLWGYKNIIKSLGFSFVFVFMNIVELQPVVSEFDINFSKRTAKVFSLIFSFFVAFVMIVFVLFLQHHKYVANEPMPLLSYFATRGTILKFFFSIGLLIALLSTLMACLLGVKRGILNKVGDNFFATSLAVVFSLLLGCFNFSFFVSVIYPIIGIMNFIIFVFL